MKLESLGEKNKTREIALLSAAVVALGYAATRIIAPASRRSVSREERQAPAPPAQPGSIGTEELARQSAPLMEGGAEPSRPSGTVLAAAGRDPFRPLPSLAPEPEDEETETGALAPSGGAVLMPFGAGGPGVLPGPDALAPHGTPKLPGVLPQAGAQAAAVKLPPVPATLLGTMIGGSRAVAIFRRAGQELELQRGSKVGFYTVVDVRHNEVLVRKYGSKAVETLYPGESTEDLGKKRLAGSVRLTTGASRPRPSAQVPSGGVVRVTIPAPQRASRVDVQPGSPAEAPDAEGELDGGVVSVPLEDEVSTAPER